MEINYVTGNLGKYLVAKEKFDNFGISLNHIDIDLPEADINDIEYISKEKARCAYEYVKEPIIVMDSGFYIRSYPNNPNYPGAFVKRSGISSNIDKLLEDMKDVSDRYCYFLDCLTYYDGEEYHTFYGKSEGYLSYEKRGIDTNKKLSNLWYVFIPMDYTKTLAEMTDLERNNRPNRVSSTIEFINWYTRKVLKK